MGVMTFAPVAPERWRWPWTIASRRVEDGETVVYTCSEPSGFTGEDLELLADDGRRHELLGGEIVVSASPSRAHQAFARGLFRLLDAAVPEAWEVLFAELALVLSASGDRPQPDLLVVPRDELSAPVGLPLLVVEILSPSTRTNDQRRKRERYALAGIEHYWMVDPLSPSVTVLRLGRGSYVATHRVEAADRLELTEPFAVTLLPDELGR